MNKITRINHINNGNGFTMVEMLVAVTIFTLLFAGIYQLQNSTLTGFNVGWWKSETQRQLVKGLKQIRDDIEKSTYPSKIYNDGTIIYGTTEPNYKQAKEYFMNEALKKTKPAGIEDFYLKYKQDDPLTYKVNPPADGSSIEIIKFKICSPKYQNAAVGDDGLIMAGSSVAPTTGAGNISTVTITWQKKDGKSFLKYERRSATPEPTDVVKEEMISYVDGINIKVEEIPPSSLSKDNYLEHEVHAIIYLNITLSSSTSNAKRSAGGSTNMIVTDGIKARCNVKAQKL